MLKKFRATSGRKKQIWKIRSKSKDREKPMLAEFAGSTFSF
jgi:hypothetical protein